LREKYEILSTEKRERLRWPVKRMPVWFAQIQKRESYGQKNGTKLERAVLGRKGSIFANRQFVYVALIALIPVQLPITADMRCALRAWAPPHFDIAE
jgi:hypothetical protein